MKIFYDTEFLDDGRAIDLISIGMVAEDGRELYLVNGDAPLRRKWWAPWRKTRVERHPWLMANVVPHLPQGHGDWRMQMPNSWLVDYMDPQVKPRAAIAAGVRDFILAADPVADPEGVELWAWYGAYDHVALAQLFGPMIDLPQGIPMFTNDLKQECVRRGNPEMPKQETTAHNALEDARWVRDAFFWLATSLEPPRSAT